MRRPGRGIFGDLVRIATMVKSMAASLTSGANEADLPQVVAASCLAVWMTVMVSAGLVDARNTEGKAEARPRLHGVAFSGPRHGWVVGERGTILRTRDGGQTWERQTIGSENLRGVAFVSEQVGCVVGDGGLLLCTADAGETWNRRSSGTTATLHRIRFGTAELGWIIGARGTILATRDGGRTWRRQRSGVRADLFDLACFSPRKCVAVGEETTFLVAGNDGSRWRLEKSLAFDIGLENVTGVTITKGNTLWIVTGSRHAFASWSEDQGRSWHQNESSILPMIWTFSVAFWDQQRGVITGSIIVRTGANGLLFTADGGATWKVAQSPGKETVMEDAVVIDDGLGWAVGRESTIFHTQDWGRTWTLQYPKP